MARWVVVAGACACAVIAAGCALAKHGSRTPLTSSFEQLELSPQELRIRVRGLIRPTLGIVEQEADRMLREASEPDDRRGVIVWKIETTTSSRT